MLIRGLIGRWPRGRVRCPWCLYDLRSLIAPGAAAADAPPICPECGRKAASVRKLSCWRLQRSALLAGLVLITAGAGSALLIKPDVLIAQAPMPWVLHAFPYLGQSQYQRGSALHTRLFQAKLAPTEERLLGRAVATVLARPATAVDGWLSSLIMAKLAPAPNTSAQPIPLQAALAPPPVVTVDDFYLRLLESGLSQEHSAALIRCCFRCDALTSRSVLDSGRLISFGEVLDCLDFGGRGAQALFWDVSWRAARASTQDREHAARVFLRGLDSGEPDTRRYAADALGALGNDGRVALPKLHELARHDPDRFVQMAASTAEMAIRKATSSAP